MKINLKHLIMLVLSFSLLATSTQGQKPIITKKNWLQSYDFNATKFKAPGNEYGPFARWWWPGNDVEKKELQREINLFADNAFGGVEIQTLNLSLPESVKTSEKVMGWDTPAYYDNLRTVMEEAQKCGLTVDLTNGSGWPSGGPFLLPEDGMLNLVFADKDIVGGNQISIAVPTTENNTGAAPRLETVLAVKVLPKKAGEDSKTIPLDPSSTIVLTDKVKNDILTWSAPAGNWKIVAFWSKPNKPTGSMVAAPKQGPVLNHFDSLKVFKNYNYLLGERTGLQKYFGNPLRAIFTDSYEFSVDRHFSHDFLTFFKKQRGYDAAPWLPANMQTAYNFAAWKNPATDPDFKFGSEDGRLKYDYDLTLSELFEKHFADASRHWTEERGVLFRNQGYGMNLDMIAIAGHASIPETESMLGVEAMLKVMASGAHLYNRPLLSSESVVYAKRAFMTTPQKTRMVVDKLFAAGVNQIIFHGIPYRYITDETMPTGWNPFCSPGINFSSDFGEANTFWKYQKELNNYIARTQYALRSGKPHADVLIYFPFMDADGMPENPSEILSKGYLENVEPALPKARLSAAVRKALAEKAEWAKIIYPFINQLEANGISWSWINDASIQVAELNENHLINIRGNKFQALALVGIETIQLKSAQLIKKLSEKGMKLLVAGELPSKQPSYLNWEANDKLTQEQLELALKATNGVHIKSNNDLKKWCESLSLAVRYKVENNYTRQTQRIMTDGSRIQYIWNTSDAWQELHLALDRNINNACWLNAETGLITQVADMKSISTVIPPFSSIILLTGVKAGSLNASVVSKPVHTAYNANKLLNIDKWDINTDSLALKNVALFDWRLNEQFKYCSNEGIYKSSFQMDAVSPQTNYFIDLGKVYFTAELYVNGKMAGKRIYAPYTYNISKLLVKGKNTIEVRITPGQLNGFIGKAVKGNPRFKAFRKDDGLLAAGLVGPVNLLQK
jgi:hypothetical protein